MGEQDLARTGIAVKTTRGHASYPVQNIVSLNTNRPDNGVPRIAPQRTQGSASRRLRKTSFWMRASTAVDGAAPVVCRIQRRKTLRWRGIGKASSRASDSRSFPVPARTRQIQLWLPWTLCSAEFASPGQKHEFDPVSALPDLWSWCRQ